MTSLKKKPTSWKARRSLCLFVVGMLLGQAFFQLIVSVLIGGSGNGGCSFAQVANTAQQDTSNTDEHTIHPQPHERSDSRNRKKRTRSHRHLLFVGVMTTRRYLRTRAKAIHETWGSALKGSLLFFVGRAADDDDGDDGIIKTGDDVKINNDVDGTSMSTNDNVSRGSFTEEEDDTLGLPVQVLSDVIDSEYPPQRKSFAMMDFLHRKYGRKYEWFLRADDDVLVDVARLRGLLSSLDSSRPVYLGHPGTGKEGEEGKLGLKTGAPYCMGGTGVVVSRAVLASLAVNKDRCLRAAVSRHEDSELGRCVFNVTGVSCLQPQHIYRRFKQNYDDTSGKWIQRALLTSKPYVTFHPVKDTRHMYRSAALVKTLRVAQLQKKVLQLVLDITCLSTRYLPSQREAELVIEAEVEATERLFGNCSAVVANLRTCELGQQSRRTLNPQTLSNIPWLPIRQNTLHTLCGKELKIPISLSGISEGLTQALRHLSRHIHAVNERQRHHHPSRSRRLVAVDQFYRRVVPGVGVEYVTFVRATSSELRPYVIRETFDDVFFTDDKQAK